MLQQLNAQVAAAIQTPHELEAEILEAEEIQDTIIEYISMIKHCLQPKRTSVEPPRTLDATAPEFVPTLASDTRPLAAVREISWLPKLTLPIFQEIPLCGKHFVTLLTQQYTIVLPSARCRSSII